MFVACGIWCVANVSSVSPSSAPTGTRGIRSRRKRVFSKLVFQCCGKCTAASLFWYSHLQLRR